VGQQGGVVACRHGAQDQAFGRQHVVHDRYPRRGLSPPR
jgi:hypothetical protein